MPPEGRRANLRIAPDRYARLTVVDGRRYGIAEYGPVTGHPVVFCHGMPSSRLEGAFFAPAARELGVRLIAVDRPGIGLSDPDPDRSYASWVDDVEQLLERLGVQELSVLGYSAGGPYALALAHHLDRVERVHRVGRATVVAGIPPAGGPAGAVGETALKVAVPLVGRLLNEARVHALLSAAQHYWHEPDRRLLASHRVRSILASSSTRAFTDHAGAALDAAMMGRPWGFAPADVVTPVHWWHGELDRDVPVTDGRRVCAELPNVTPHWFEAEAHLSIVVRQAERIVASTLPA